MVANIEEFSDISFILGIFHFILGKKNLTLGKFTKNNKVIVII